MSTLLSFDLDLDIQDYAGDAAQQVAETYNHKECLEVIREHLKKQKGKLRSPRHSPSRKSSPNSTHGRSGSIATGTTAVNYPHTARASSPACVWRSLPDAKRDSLDVSNLSDPGPHDFHDVLFAHPDVQHPNSSVS